jgi:hemerythrin-like domain-containing protein
MFGSIGGRAVRRQLRGSLRSCRGDWISPQEVSIALGSGCNPSQSDLNGFIQRKDIMVTANGTRATSKPQRPRSATARRGNGSAPDAIKFLKGEHQSVERLFKSFERAGDGAHKTKRRLVDHMIAELSQHAAIEEEVLYPAARRAVASSEDEVLEALEEHHLVKWELRELQGMAPTEERFQPKVAVLIENVRHHVREEEGELFPLLRAELGRKRLLELGDELRTSKRFAPTRPHPRSPDEPPGNLLPNTVAGAVDKARDLVRSARPGG